MALGGRSSSWGLAGGGTGQRDVGLGQDVHLSMCFWRMAPGGKGGRESRRGNLDLFCTFPVIKLGQVRYHGWALMTCWKSLGEELVCPSPLIPHALPQTQSELAQGT